MNGTRVAVMALRVYFGFIFATNSIGKPRFWLKMLIQEHLFRVNSWPFRKYLLLLSPS